MKIKELSDIIGSNHNGNWAVYELDMPIKDITKNIQTAIDTPENIKKKLIRFYNWWHAQDWEFDKLYQWEDIHHEFNLSFENTRLTWYIKDQLSFLAQEQTCCFDKTINKYRNIMDWEVKDWQFTYKYIDTMWNLKEKQESIISLMKYYRERNQLTAQDILPTVDIRVVMSSRPEDKFELFEHLGFNGSCQKRENCTGNAHWFYDMFYNWWFIVIKMYQWTKFVWRSLCRTVYDWDKKFLFIDRIYREWVVSQLQDVHWTLYKQIYDLGYNLLLSNQWYDCLESAWLKWMRKAKELYVWPARKIHHRRATYYNSWESMWVSNWDYMFDTVNASFYNVYKCEHEPS